MVEIIGSKSRKLSVVERFPIEDFWWVGAAVAGVLVAIVLPRLVPKTDVGQEPFPRAAEHAEV